MFVFAILLVSLQVCLGNEPECSKFAYEESLLEKMIRTEIKFEKVQNELNQMSGEFRKAMDTMKNTLEDIKTERQMNREAWNDLNQTVFSEVGALINNSKTKFKENERIIERLSDDVRSMSANLLSNVTGLAKTPIVAFKATGMKTSSPVTGENLVFPNVLFNLQDGYDSATGIFTAPVSGLYIFTVQTCTVKAQYITVDIMLEGKMLGRGFTRDYADYPCNSADAIGLINCGGTAYIKVHSVTANGLFEDAHRLPSFSGALLNKT